MSTNPYLRPQEIKSVAVIGTGSVGASWAALFLAHDMAVVAFDPGPDAEQRTRDFIEAAWPALVELGVAQAPIPPLQKLSFVATAVEAARAADLVQENTPEKPELKARALAEIDAAATPDKIILSSTGGIPPSQLQESCRHPERFVVAHPFNPSHLIPLVEIVGGKQTAPEVVEWAVEFARHVGKQPIRLNVEANGHMTNRLQFALVREAVHCLLEGVASARDIDAAVRYGLGPRWTLMGSLLTLHLAGGPGGMKGILDHAGSAIEEWWTPMSQPRLTSEVKQRLVNAAEEASAGQPIAEWTAWRDEQLVDVLKLQAASELREPK
jgi:carnitine 3-dehydrogenase